MARLSLADWMHECVLDNERSGRCTAFALVHMLGTGEESIHVKKLADKIGASDIDDAAEMFRNKAQTYAQGIPGAQTFCLQAFWNNESRAASKYPFVEAGYVEIDGLMTEAPTGKGLLQQMMRHNEAIISRSNDKDRHLFDALLKTLDMKVRESEALKRENIESFGMIKDLVLQMANRQHELKLAEIAAQSTAQIKAEVAKWAPRLLNTLTGREIVPEPALDSQLVEDLIDALSQQGEGALPALAGLKLPPALMMSLADRFQRGMKVRQRERVVRESVDEKDETPADGLQ